MLGNKTPPPEDAKLKAFLIICNCKGTNHDENNKTCPVEKFIHILISLNQIHIVHDIIDCQPIAHTNEGAEEVKHDEVTE